jgi:hypothetical protein
MPVATDLGVPTTVQRSVPGSTPKSILNITFTQDAFSDVVDRLAAFREVDLPTSPFRYDRGSPDSFEEFWATIPSSPMPVHLDKPEIDTRIRSALFLGVQRDTMDLRFYVVEPELRLGYYPLLRDVLGSMPEDTLSAKIIHELATSAEAVVATSDYPIQPRHGREDHSTPSTSFKVLAKLRDVLGNTDNTITIRPCPPSDTLSAFHHRLNIPEVPLYAVYIIVSGYPWQCAPPPVVVLTDTIGG